MLERLKTEVEPMLCNINSKWENLSGGVEARRALAHG